MIMMMMMMLMLFWMSLIVHAEESIGDDDNYGDENGNDNVAPYCACFHVTSETLPIQSLAFCGLSGQLKKRTQNNKTMIAMVFANTFTKKRTKN